MGDLVRGVVGGAERAPLPVAGLGGEDDAVELSALDVGGEFDGAGGARFGAWRVTAGFAAGSASLPEALRTIVEPAGTVTVIFRSAPLVTEASVPWMPRKAMRAEPVAKVAFFVSSALLKATTYSVVSWPVRVPVVVREKA